MEGFANASQLQNVFTSVLKVPKSTIQRTNKNASGRPRTAIANSSCSGSGGSTQKFSSVATPPMTVQGEATAYTPTPFLKQMLENEKAAVEALLKVAAKIGPVAQTVVEKEKAYNSAFESAIPAAVPMYSSSLQGFSLVLLIVSFLSMAIVMTIYVNATTNSAGKAGGTFISFLIIGTVAIALLKRFG